MQQTTTADDLIAREEPPTEAADLIAEHCIRTTFDDLSDDVVAATKAQVFDTVGIALGGRNQPGVTELREFTLEMGGKPESRIWGTDIRVPAQDAARVNATMGHALDYDDTHEPSFMHTSVVTIPTALAIADMLGTVSGRDLITAVALGVDVSCRLSAACRPGITGFVHGWHNTTLYGIFAATLVAGKLMGLTRDELISAMGIAYQQASGNSQAHVDGALTKRMGPGFASYAGIVSARLAKRGVRGATGVFDGLRGFFFQYHNHDVSREILLRDLGTQFRGAELSFKPWPSCRGSHTAADAALRLVHDKGLTADQIEELTIFNAAGDFSLLDTPLEKKQRPDSAVDAQFSNPWVVTAALVDREISTRHFTAGAIERPDMLAFASRIRTGIDDSLARPGGGAGGARIHVRLRDGSELSQTVERAKGAPNNPMNASEFRAKFMDCTRLAGMRPERADTLLDTLDRTEMLRDVSEITSAATLQS